MKWNRIFLSGIIPMILLAGCAESLSPPETSLGIPDEPTDSEAGNNYIPFTFDEEADIKPEIREIPKSPEPAEDQPDLKAAKALVDQAAQYINEGRLEEAESTLNEALRLSPSYGPAFELLSNIASKNEDPEKAREYLERAQDMQNH